MPRWLLVVIFLFAGILAWKLWFSGGPAFDLEKFESDVRKLSRAADLVKRMSDQADLPDYLEVDISYLQDVEELLTSAEDCRDVAASVRERFRRYQKEKAGMVDAVTVEEIMQMDPRRQRQVGMQLIGHLAPAWVALLEPVRDFCDRCPEESEVLTGALGTVQQ